MTLSEYMARHKNTDAEIAARLGVTRSYISFIRTEARSPSLALALRIFRELGLKLGPLVGASKAEIAALSRVHSRRAA